MKLFNPYKMFNGSFVPEQISCIPDKELSSGAKLVYGRFMRYAGKDGKCNPKRATLAREVGFSVSNIDKLIKSLVEFGLVKKTQHGLRKSNSYEFIWHEVYTGVIEGGDYESHTEIVPETHSEVSPSIKESQLKRVNEVKPEEKKPYQELPVTLGKTRHQRIMRIYSKLWQREFNSDWVANFPRFGKALKVYDNLSEPQVAVLILTHFNWYGMSGSDDFTHKRLFNAGFPIEWITTSQAQYIAFLKNSEKVDFMDEKSVYLWLSKQINRLSTV